MGILHRVLTAGISRLPLRRKVQVVDIALGYLAEASYVRLARSGFLPGAIIDVGAYRGEWTRLIAQAFPQAPVLMIEAQAEKVPYLQNVKVDLPQAEAEICLLGSADGASVTFHVMETGSSIYSERSNVPRTNRILAQRTLDAVLLDRDFLRTPLFIKLDVQGAELDVLQGGKCALEQAEIVQMEVALTQYNEGAPEAAEVVAFMEARGFSIYDICGFVRPNPTYLSQIDVLFVRRTSKLRRNYFTLEL